VHACLQAYVRHLILEELSPSSLASVLRRLLRLPWAECERYVLKCMTKVLVLWDIVCSAVSRLPC
jgi:hypothetical protein